jgi:TPR repeat protein
MEFDSFVKMRVAQGILAAGQYALGLMYEKGRGTVQGFQMAALWYEKAAKQGYTDAEERLKAMRQDAPD